MCSTSTCSASIILRGANEHISIPIIVSIASGDYYDGLSVPFISYVGRDEPSYYVFAVGMSLSGAGVAVVAVLERAWIVRARRYLGLQPTCATHVLVVIMVIAGVNLATVTFPCTGTRSTSSAGSTTAPPHHRRHHWIDDVPAGVLLARVPWGAEHRTVEQWAWLCEAAVEGALAESAAARAVAEYLARGGPPGGGGEGEEEAEEALEEGKLRGCAEVWRLRAYVDEELLEALARGGE